MISPIDKPIKAKPANGILGRFFGIECVSQSMQSEKQTEQIQMLQKHHHADCVECSTSALCNNLANEIWTSAARASSNWLTRWLACKGRSSTRPLFCLAVLSVERRRPSITVFMSPVFPATPMGWISSWHWKVWQWLYHHSCPHKSVPTCSMVFPSGTGWCSWCFGSKCQGQMWMLHTSWCHDCHWL